MNCLRPMRILAQPCQDLPRFKDGPYDHCPLSTLIIIVFDRNVFESEVPPVSK
eukprot:14329.XXX_801_959_1 [CDS] Oithona nana genome sequencing.